MVSLGGLGAAYGGYTQAGLDTQALNTAELDALGARALGKTFQAMLPGAAQGAQGVPAMGGQQYPPQPPQQPGQPSVPMMHPGQQQGPPQPMQAQGGIPPPPMPGSAGSGVQQAAFQPQGANPMQQGGGDPMAAYRKQIGSMEAKSYQEVGPNTGRMGEALGQYGIMSANLPQWSQETFGRPVSRQEFLSSPAIQDAIFNKKFGEYTQKYGPREAASIWLTGRQLGQGGAGARDLYGTSGQAYSDKFMRGIGGQGGPPGQGGLPPPQGQFDLNTAAAAIARANPGIQPEVLVHALSKAMPYLNTQAQYQVRQAQMEMREAQLNQRDEALKQGQDKIMQQQQKMEDQRQQFIEKQQLGEKKVEQGQQRIDIAKEKEAAKALDPAVAKFMASQLLTGQPPTSVLGGMARNAQAVQQVRAEFAKQAMEQGVSPQEIGRRMQEFGGQATAYKALGTAEARMANAAMSADVLIPVLEDASKKVSRTDFPDLNRIIQAAETKTGSPEVVAFGNAIQSVANTYAGVMSRGYQPSEASRKSAAMKLLNQYWSQGQLDAGIAIIRKEIAAEMSAPGKVRDYWAAQKRDQTQGQAPGTPGGLQPDQTQLKPLTPELRTQAQESLKRGWTLDQIKQRMREHGYDDSTIQVPTRDTTPGG